MYGASITANYKTLGSQYNYEDDFLTLTGSIGGVFNAFSRIFTGLLFDCLSFKTLFGMELAL